MTIIHVSYAGFTDGTVIFFYTVIFVLLLLYKTVSSNQYIATYSLGAVNSKQYEGTLI